MLQARKNPADLFTKHLESSKKLDQLLKLFNCTIVSGRAESAPGLKTAKGAEDQGGVSLVELQMLPHQLPLAEMNRRHATAVPDEERYGEVDLTPQSELSDPVPLLARRSAAPSVRVRPKRSRMKASLYFRRRPTNHSARSVVLSPARLQAWGARARFSLQASTDDPRLPMRLGSWGGA